MQHVKATLFAFAALAVLGGCTTSYRETLEQKLEGKSQNERRAILAQECGQEIRNGLKPENESNVRHFENMKKICEEMTGKPVTISAVPGKK